MKKLFTFLLIFLSSFSYSQNLNVKFLEQIMKVSFLDIEKVMTEGYGFTLIKNDSNGKELKFAKIPDNDIDSAIIITIFDTKFTSNTLDITVAKKFSIEKIKENFIENNYLYVGENKYGFWAYEKNHITTVISKEPNSAGANQIIITYKE